jgi:hypothetical protein
VLIKLSLVRLRDSHESICWEKVVMKGYAYCMFRLLPFLILADKSFFRPLDSYINEFRMLATRRYLRCYMRGMVSPGISYRSYLRFSQMVVLDHWRGTIVCGCTLWTMVGDLLETLVAMFWLLGGLLLDNGGTNAGNGSGPTVGGGLMF